VVEVDQRRELDLARRNAEHAGLRYRSLVAHWLGRLFRPPAQPHPIPLPEVARGQVAITFAGHASALIRYGNLAIACDPMLGDFVGAARREVAPGLSAAELGDVDLVLISHGGKDHLHLPTLARLPRSATVIVPPRTGHLVSKLGFARLIELTVGQSIEHRRVDVTATAVRRGDADAPALSYVVRGDGPSVFFCGESGYFSGFAEVGRRYRPDLALLPIGGYAPDSFRERHLSPIDALFAFEDLRARLLVPIRHGAFALSYERLDEPERWLRDLVAERRLEQHVLMVAVGESRVFSLPSAAASTAAADALPIAATEPVAATRAGTEVPIVEGGRASVTIDPPLEFR
jgi:L-ascorbate metabolism protein UlaG (beta-lactamase superfamily)